METIHKHDLQTQEEKFRREIGQIDQELMDQKNETKKVDNLLEIEKERNRQLVDQLRNLEIEKKHVNDAVVERGKEIRDL